MKHPDFSNYVSPFSWRYGTDEMKHIFSEENKYRLWRKVWISLAKVQKKASLITEKELDDLITHQDDLDILRIVEIEEETHHDVVAAIREFAEKAKIGGGKIHLGATSMDICDNTDSIRIKQALQLVEAKLIKLLHIFAEQIEIYAKVPCIGYTHLQPAEPTTVGYRLAFYAQDLCNDLEYLIFVKKIVKGKGMKGAVGTRASYTEILKKTGMTAEKMDHLVAEDLQIEVVDIANQIYPRKFDYLVLSLLASISSSLAKFAGDVRLLQSPTIGEWSEPFGKKQVGSSAMPFKKNPVNSEKLCSLARYIAQLPVIALENASLSYLERTLDDSANKRLIIAEGFITLDEILKIAEKLIGGLVVNRDRIAYNLSQFAPFAASESLIISAVKHGADRQKIHELLRVLSMEAWVTILAGKPNPLITMLENNSILRKYLTKDEISETIQVHKHVGDAPERALQLSARLRKLRI